jgi:hypothetical protein
LSDEASAQLATFLKSHESLSRVMFLRREAAAVEKLLTDIQDNSRWTNVKESGSGVRTSYRNETDTPVHTLKVEGWDPCVCCTPVCVCVCVCVCMFVCLFVCFVCVVACLYASHFISVLLHAL